MNMKPEVILNRCIEEMLRVCADRAVKATSRLLTGPQKGNRKRGTRKILPLSHLKVT